MGRLDLPDVYRDEGFRPTRSDCVICERPHGTASDARLPLLRVALCRRCRDAVAAIVGWWPTRRGDAPQQWNRDGRYVILAAERVRG